jgi:hypothetical protein
MYQAVRGIPDSSLPCIVDNTLGKREYDRPQRPKVLGGHEQAKVTHHLAAAPLDNTIRLRSLCEIQDLLNLEQAKKLSYDLVLTVGTAIGPH